MVRGNIPLPAVSLRLRLASRATEGEQVMADHVVPHFHNDAGVPVIEIGSQEFMCVGANPPFDHPHVFLDLGNDNEIILLGRSPSKASSMDRLFSAEARMRAQSSVSSRQALSELEVSCGLHSGPETKAASTPARS